MITGKNYIGNELSASGNKTFKESATYITVITMMTDVVLNPCAKIFAKSGFITILFSTITKKQHYLKDLF